jgi:hypothetical protein
LQHKKYDNIFGVGDVLNVPTTKTFYGGINQIAVVRHNIERKINGLSMNAKYDGFSEAPLFLSNHNLTWASHKYDGEDVSFDTSAISSSLRYKVHSLLGASSLTDIMAGKSWGPPYYKAKKTFETTEVPQGQSQKKSS